MARASTPTLLSLERYAKVMGINPVHFNCKDMQVARFDIFKRAGNTATIEFHYCVVTVQEGFQYWQEHASVGLFSHEVFLQSLHRAALHVLHDPRNPHREDGKFKAYIATRS